jgi:hypothetical protein
MRAGIDEYMEVIRQAPRLEVLEHEDRGNIREISPLLLSDMITFVRYHYQGKSLPH